MTKLIRLLSTLMVILYLNCNHIDCKVIRLRGKKLNNRIVQLNSSRKIEPFLQTSKAAKIIKSSHFDYDFMLGQKIKFLCVAQGTPIPTINWLKDGIELYNHPYANVYEWLLPNNQIKSKLEIDPARQMDAGTYECQANNKYTVDRKQFKADF